MIVWAGGTGGFFDTGGRYNPASDTWVATSTLGAPAGRSFNATVWTGSEMIVWAGGQGAGGVLDTGGRYDPSSDTWEATSTHSAPAGRAYLTAVWTVPR